MKKTRLVSLLLALALVAAVFAGCAPTAAAPTPAGVTDMTGREVALAAPAQKVVVLTAADCEILYAIGAGDMVVGRGEYCTYPEAVLGVPAVQSGAETNIEQIIGLAPDLVIVGTMAQTQEQIAALENAGIKVAVSNAQNIEGVYQAIAMIGALTGKDAEAAAVVDNMKSTFADIASKVTGKGEKTVYFEVSPLEYGLWAAGSGTFMDELATMLGLTNAFKDVQTWGEISQEQVFERDPDYIVTIAMYFGEGQTPVEEIIGREGWQNLKAVKNNAIINADSNEISLPGPRLADAAKTLYAFIYEGKAVAPAA
ncbi:MAG: ABC transporter substrate-binding protein [Bacillota bacterium]